MFDPAAEVLRYNAGRDPDRVLLKYQRMRESPFSFLRGTCHLFHQRLPQAAVLAEAPLAWICGDLHLENFGCYKGGNRLVYFDLTDFDEAVRTPASWDVLRMLTSILVAADELHIGGKEPRQLCKAFVASYATALAEAKPLWVERETATGLVQALLERRKKRDRAAFLEARTRSGSKHRELALIPGRTLPIATAKERRRLEDAWQAFRGKQPAPRFFSFLDAARRVAGTGSLGVQRYVVLTKGEGSPDGHYLFDLKQSLPSAVLPHPATPQPQWPSEAARIVTLQHMLQAVPIAHLQTFRLGREEFMLRELQPTEDKVDLRLPGLEFALLAGAVATMGQLAAWMHLRGSGRMGAANADELSRYGEAMSDGWKPLWQLARHCAEQVESDWRAYSKAFDAGAFAIPRQGGKVRA